MLLARGARVNATNMGDDIPLHLAAAHGHLDVVQVVSIIDCNHHQSGFGSDRRFITTWKRLT